jgi:hypothetical protein
MIALGKVKSGCIVLLANSFHLSLRTFQNKPRVNTLRGEALPLTLLPHPCYRQMFALRHAARLWAAN